MMHIDVFGICTVGACVRAGAGSPRQPPPPPAATHLTSPVTALLHTAKLYIGKRFFISTCHNKVDDGRYSSRIVMFCFVGGFFYVGNNNNKAFGSAKLMLEKLDPVCAPRYHEYDIQSR